MCQYCKETYYVKRIQYTKPNIAPATKADELRYALLDLTGEVYVPFEILYCPVCGHKIEQITNTVNYNKEWEKTNA